MEKNQNNIIAVKNKWINTTISTFRLCKRSIRVYLNYPELYRKQPVVSHEIRLKKAMEWLSFAQDKSGNGGVPSTYNVLDQSWGFPYRETTGYIIPTFIQYSKMTGEKKYEDRALAMAEWELTEQLPDGSFGEETVEGAIVKKIFNTGQVLLGFCFLYTHTHDERFLSGARRSANWLLEQQETDGSWEKNTTDGARTYHARVAWSLLELYKITHEETLKQAAQKNLTWTMNKQNEKGWFEDCSLAIPGKPWTHLIAYTIRGLLESSAIIESHEMFESAYKAAGAIRDYYTEHTDDTWSWLPGTFDSEWVSMDTYSCLTGNMQMAIIWLKIYNRTKEEKFKTAALRIIEQTSTTQVINSHTLEIVGGIAGSYPLSGRYGSYKILNWATKFYADALMLAMDNTLILPA